MTKDMIARLDKTNIAKIAPDLYAFRILMVTRLVHLIVDCTICSTPLSGRTFNGFPITDSYGWTYLSKRAGVKVRRVYVIRLSPNILRPSRTSSTNE